MKNVTLDHLNLTTSNLDHTLDWYREVFGFQMVERGVRSGRPWAIVRSGENMLCFYESPHRKRADHASDETHRIYHFGLRIADRARWERLLHEREDILLDHGPVRYPHSTSWYVLDPSGHEIEVALWDKDSVEF